MRAALLVLSLAACAQLEWTKPGADAEALRQDLDACRAGARASAARMAEPAPALSPSVDPRFGATSPQTRRVEQPVQEDELLNACMRERGYRLVPAARG